MTNQNNNLNVMTKDTLDERYMNFCEKHDLDCTIPAEEQVYLTTPQQMWIDRHVAHINRAANAGHYMTAEEAEKESKNLNTEAAQSEQAEQKEALTQTAVNAPADKKSRIERYKDNLIGMANLVDVARKSSIAVCPSPSAVANSKLSKTGELQLGLAW